MERYRSAGRALRLPSRKVVDAQIVEVPDTNSIGKIAAN